MSERLSGPCWPTWRCARGERRSGGEHAEVQRHVEAGVDVACLLFFRVEIEMEAYNLLILDNHVKMIQLY